MSLPAGDGRARPYCLLHCDDFNCQGVGELQIKSILLRSILGVVLVFFPQFVCAGNLKPPFRLLWERKRTLTQFCNNKCIQSSLYGFDVIDPLTGRVSLSRHFRSDNLVGCNELQGHAVIFVRKKKLISAYDIEAGKVLWNVLLDADRRYRDSLFDKNRLYSEFRQGVITAIDSGKGAVLWRRDIMSNLGSEEREEYNSLILRDGGDGLIVLKRGKDSSTVIVLDKSSGFTINESPLLPLYSDLIVADGAVVIKGPTGVEAYDRATWRKLWSFSADYDLETGLYLWNGHIIFGLLDGYLYSLGLDGSLQWKAPVSGAEEIGRGSMGKPFFLKDHLLIGSNADLLSIGIDGKEIWRLDTGERRLRNVNALSYPQSCIIIAGDTGLACFGAGSPMLLPASRKARITRIRHLASCLGDLSPRKERELVSFQRDAFPVLLEMAKKCCLNKDKETASGREGFDYVKHRYGKNVMMALQRRLLKYERKEDALWRVFKQVVKPEDTTALFSLFYELKSDKARGPILDIMAETIDSEEVASFFIGYINKNRSGILHPLVSDYIANCAATFIRRSNEPSVASYIMDELEHGRDSMEFSLLAFLRLPFIGGEKGRSMVLSRRKPSNAPRSMSDEEKIIEAVFELMAFYEIPARTPCTIVLPEGVSPFKVRPWPFVIFEKKETKNGYSVSMHSRNVEHMAFLCFSMPFFDFAGRQVPRDAHSWILWNKTRTEAKLHLTRWYGPLEAKGFDIHLKKIDNNWFIYDVELMWCS